MAKQIDNDWPAFPVNEQRMSDEISMSQGHPGQTIREYAAIKLRVPNSGLDWLDDMIRESMRDEFAGQALDFNDDCDVGHIAETIGFEQPPELTADTVVECERYAVRLQAAWRYYRADAMLAARKTGATE